MEYVPGLKPQNESGAKGRRSQKQGRTPVNEPQSRVGLRPSASPANYYNRPAQPQKNQRAQQFIQALGQVSDVSGRLGEYMYEKQRKEAEQQAQQEIQSMSLEEAKQKVQSGEISQYDNPYFQDAFQRQYGIRLGLHKGREMRAKFETGFDPRNDDVDEFIQDHLDPQMEQVGDNPIIAEAFTETVDQDVQKLREEDYSAKAAAIEQDKLDGAYETGLAQFEKRLSDAQTPEDRQRAIEQGYQEWRDGYAERRELLGLTNAEQDTLTMQLAAKFAREGDVDVVEKLLTDDRGGIGAIIDKRGEMGADAAQVLNTAEQQFQADNEEETFDQRMSFFDQARQGKLDRDELIGFHKQNPGAYTDAKVQSLISTNESAQEAKREQLRLGRIERRLQEQQASEQGDVLDATLEAMENGQVHNLGAVPVTKDIDPETGEVEREMLTPEKRIENAERVLQERKIPEYAAQFPEDERAMRAFEYEVDIYSKNPKMENQQWKDTLSDVGSTLSTAAGNGEIPPKLREGYTLYKNLKSLAPGMLTAPYVSERDKDVYESIRYAEQYEGLELDQAVQRAYQIRQNDNEDNRFTSTQFQEMDQAVDEINGWGDGWGDIKNTGYVTAELDQLAQYQARAGGASDVNSVVERFKEEHEYINGHAVPTRGRNIPDNFKEAAQEKLKQYANDHPEEMEELGLESSDLTLFPMGGNNASGAWAIIDGTTANPVNNPVDSRFTMSELLEDAEEAREARARSRAEKTNTPRSERMTPSELEQDDRLNPSGNLQGQSGTVTDRLRDHMTQTPGAEGEDDRDSAQMEQSGRLGGNSTEESLFRRLTDHVTRIPGSNSQEEQSNESDILGPNKDTLREDERAIDASEAKPTTELDRDPRKEAKLPENEDPLVKKFVETARELGMTKDQFKRYVRSAAKDPHGTAVPLMVDPVLRDRIKAYLPPS